MSTKYPGGIISKTAPVPAGPFENGAAPGIWTLEQQAAYVKQGIWPTAGNVDPSAFIENLFSTYLYTGNGSTQTITNGIDLSGEGGLTWIKTRGTDTNYSNLLFDTVRGATKVITSNTTDAESTFSTGLTAFTSSGFSVGSGLTANKSGNTLASWTFRKQPKFFDIVTYTGTGSAQNIAHNLGSVPGAIFVKRTSDAEDWLVYHRSTGNQAGTGLNETAATYTGVTAYWNSTTPTDSVFTVNTHPRVNTSGETYVAYLFAHDAGGFGTSGNDNVISCGSYTGDGTNGQSVSLGYEPQWLLIKRTDSSASWFLQDNMRPFSVTATEWLQPNTANAESAGGVAYVSPTATGFTFTSGGSSAYNANGGTYIYIAIRRGPMKTPTTGTSVFAPVAYAGDSSATRLVNAGVNIDMNISARRSGPDFFVQSRLIGVPYLRTRSVNAETSSSGSFGIPTILTSENNKFGFIAGSTDLANVNATGSNYVDWAFSRAPGFFDVSCYTGTGSSRTVTHNLTVAPELMLVKQRSGTEVWSVYYGDNTDYLVLNSDQATADSNIYWNDTSPTSSVFTLGTGNEVNSSGSTYVAYLFATCPGVSKVGSYTGTGAAQTINCGFAAGARFVLIKRIDSTGDWFVWDTARGMIPANDPYLRLNTSAAEVTGTDYVDTASTGFEISSTAPDAINASGGIFVFLAIA
jgi:hypothetical protein